MAVVENIPLRGEMDHMIANAALGAAQSDRVGDLFHL